jgi:phosphoribosyl 1,2-cyclic phosphodiesterase
MALTVAFWGTRGSIPCPSPAGLERRLLARALAAATPADIADPAAVEAFIDGGCRGALPTRHGGDTSCVELRAADGARLLLDLGSGARAFAVDLIARAGPRLAAPLDILLSHLHWDHIQGFPFFGLAFVPGNTLRLHGCHDGVEEALRGQMAPPFFPVPFDALGATIVCNRLRPGETTEIAGFRVTPFALPHPGGSFAYRIERDGRTVVYATDGEIRPETADPGSAYVAFIRDADVLIFDAQYSLADAVSVKEDWGHASNVVGVELALLGGVRELVLFHHDPLSSDAQLDEIVANARAYEAIMREGRPALAVRSAWDGLEMTLP